MKVSTFTQPKLSAFLILIFFSFQNCATLLSIPHWLKPEQAVIYSGTRCDLKLLNENDNGKFDPIYLIDLPFSATLDTILLPVSIVVAYIGFRYNKDVGIGNACTE
ncbi:MAG: YceK/YidQ family lipoprotein [Leptospiraceae bacterium]|nr:YceK/YidQ family lipoprotein [Leptospiraceae bacterium]